MDHLIWIKINNTMIRGDIQMGFRLSQAKSLEPHSCKLTSLAGKSTILMVFTVPGKMGIFMGYLSFREGNTNQHRRFENEGCNLLPRVF